MRGIAQGIPTKHLADELELDYGALLGRRHKIQQLALGNKPNETLSDEHTEADEMFQNAGEKGTRHSDPEDPPRRRANKRKGRGTMKNDRPPILGVVGRHSGQLRLTVCENGPLPNKSPFSLKLSAPPRMMPMSTLMNVPLITISVKQVVAMPVSAILDMNGLGMMMVTVYEKFTATH